MTHQNHQTNGASLEDCHTNFFALTDLCGIKWRKLVIGERPNASSDPLDDPVLRSYSRCLAADMLCVWRRVAAIKSEPSGALYDISLPVPGSSGNGYVVHPPLSLNAAKELWIFWYGEEPDLTDLVVPELLKANEGSEQGSWESALSYECRSLLFKALHNLIERSLLSRDVVRLGRWFVQPCSGGDRASGKSSHHLSFSFAFFVHGDSTVCASMDLREHPAVRRLTPEYIAEAQQTANGGGSVEVRPKPVILAPFGLSATLTGQTFRSGSMDPVTQKALDDWCAFYPLNTNGKDNSDLPLMVEVVSGGIKLRYPSKYVLVTDIDENTLVPGKVVSTGGTQGGLMNGGNVEKCLMTTAHQGLVSPNSVESENISHSLPDMGFSHNDLGNPLSMHLAPSVATVLPERVWQDCITNPLAQSVTGGSVTSTTSTCSNIVPISSTSPSGSSSSSSSSSSNSSSSNGSTGAGGGNAPGSSGGITIKQEPGEVGATPPSNGGNGNSDVGISGPSWTFTDPTQKASCTCLRAGNQQQSHPSYPRHSSLAESLVPIPSVGSPGSAGPSPHPNSTQSQPTSVPSADQMLSTISPHPPSSVSAIVQPPTPSEAHLDKNTPAATPTDQHDAKAVASPYQQQQQQSISGDMTVSTPTSMSTASGTAATVAGTANCHTTSSFGTTPKHMTNLSEQQQQQMLQVKKIDSTGSLKSNNILSNSGSINSNINNLSVNNSASNNLSNNNSGIISGNSNSFVSSLKRPQLCSKDYENIIDDDYVPHQLLYDYSTWEAWLNHPVKRYKPNEESKPNQSYDLYAGRTYSSQPHFPPSTLTGLASPSAIEGQVMKSTASGIGSVGATGCGSVGGDEEAASPLLQAHEIKKEASDVGDGAGKEVKCLTENLFTSEGLQASYKDLDQIFDSSDETSNDEAIPVNVHTPPGSNKSMGGMDEKRCISSCNPSTGGIRPYGNEELSKMFPTPPSLEHHPNSSPCGGALSDVPMTDIHSPKLKLENYPNLGSPSDEPIEDWTYVFVPPNMSKFVGSSKYAPLSNLPSQSLLPVTLPMTAVYKPSWLKQQQLTGSGVSSGVTTGMGSGNSSSGGGNSGGTMVKQERIEPPLSTPTTPAMPTPPNPMSRPSSVGLLGGPTSMMAGGGGGGGGGGAGGGPPPPPPPTIMTPNVMMPMGMNMLANGNYGQGPPMQGHPGGMLKPGMSPISPATGQFPTVGSPMHGLQHPFRRTPIPPPPPYELAIASPATSTSSYLNKQFNSEDPATPSMGPRGTPEANALLVNVLLYDTLLNVFRDHNFDSCTICVCNAGKKCVGNIRGSDSGVYLALPGTSFASMTSALGNSSVYSGGGNSGFGLDSPAAMTGGGGSGGGGGGGNGHQNGYFDEDPIKCQCGFSAVMNRRLAHRAGLFYEDEMEITGMAEDPSCHKKRSLLTIILGQSSGVDDGGPGVNAVGGEMGKEVMVKQEAKSNDGGGPGGGGGGGNGGNSSGNSSNCDNMPLILMDLLREQCAVVQSSSNSIQRAIKCFRGLVATSTVSNMTTSPSSITINVLDYSDAQDVISLALEQGRIAFETNILCKMEMDSHYSNSRLAMISQPPNKTSLSVHKWPYVRASGPRSNQDIVRIMKSMQPLLQDAFHKKCTTRLWDAPYTVQGPLTWRQFHRLAGRGTGQCEPQPIPSVVVGHEKDWLSVAPYAIHYWDKLLLEPYSYARDVAYVVITPDNDAVVTRVKTYFKELSTTYEMCKLGRHTPIKGWEGLLRVGKNVKNLSALPGLTPNASINDTIDEWFTLLGDSKMSENLKFYAQACQVQLVPYLNKVLSDKSLLDPPEGASSSSIGSGNLSKDRSLPSPMPPPNTPESSQTSDKAPSTPKSDNDCENQRESLNASSSTPTNHSDPLGSSEDDEINPPCIVVYIVEPFTCLSDTSDRQRLAVLALLRCYSNILSSVPEGIRSNIQFQLISQESIMELGRSRDQLRFSDEMRCLALSVFSQCRRYLTHTSNVKSLTGFGTAANMELFLKNKDEKNREPYKLYTPPYILAAQHEKSENAELFGTASIEQQSSVLYCSYCLSEDQSWLLAVATDERGELLETVTINIDIPNRRRRKKASARRLGLQKLMDFILGVISQSVQPWRLVVGRIGRIGHGELKGWSWLLSKQNLLKASKQLKDICKQCSLQYPHAAPSILSACLITLEPDSTLRVMPDQFTPDERFSQISMQNPLATPQDVTCTHILVFPTSAIAQSSQTAFQDIQHINDLDEEFFPSLDDDDGMDGMEAMNGLGDIFDQWDTEPQMPPASPERASKLGSPGGMEDNRSRQSPGPSGGNCSQTRNLHSSQDTEEVGQLLQQPLALGYLVSTAPTGRMPSWFWSSCPHMENVCPVFLKTALHLHSPAIQQNTDDLLQQNHSSATDHPLDSQFTADVLRHVLEGYNVLSWLAMDANTRDRLSCLPIHVQVLMQLYHMTAALA
ncbi:mediator of RNA polymerase II transcription subunit 13 isoform X2 [Phlebotomus papatasi]|uniref:mediator of RNA polymerase II transcription subunit 13 isoform X2 n=1 Tax=Phlebotomus papatasi TaxID=29031 RepID=UPI0024842D92|nr:mediator of RNA polymerase II transcription subunit 13 isoform X2 [Phlebotomus papatasi]